MSGLSVLTLFLPSSQTAQDYGDESSLTQLDIFLDRASANGMYVIVSFISGLGMALMDESNPWHSPNGVGGLIHNQKLKIAYKDLLKRVVTRKNSVNGKLYRDDPTIMAWDLITEPIGAKDKAHVPNIALGDFKPWLQEMTSYVRDLDSNHLVTMCLVGPTLTRDWLETIMPELDFLFADANLYDMVYPKNQPMTEDYLDKCYLYPIFSIRKPILPQLAFTSPNLDEKFATDYAIQGQIYQEALLKGFQRGMAGATIFSWGTKQSFKAEIPTITSSFERYLTYDVLDEDIVIPLLKASASLGTINWPKLPLQFVRVAP